jgi:protein-tyrosine phosphatase
MNVLFVCLGNICRSPAAEWVMIDMLVKEGLEGQVAVDSAGTSAYHAGELPDRRMREHAKLRGLDLRSRSRQFIESDFEDFDIIVVMDDSNYRNVMHLDVKDHYQDKVVRMADLCPNFSDNEVPDPYYGGDQGVEHVLDMVTEGCQNLLEKIKHQL